ncbi:sugar ABC transporter ATP-binding protein [Modestobacter muralis]|uniref:sugar ABC transporter ATP-binding protein n=1 Tax=Modestobacter muralis TaxID=1608614 RepID=UPI0030B8D5CD
MSHPLTTTPGRPPGRPHDGPLLTVSGVTKSFAGVHALRGVDFTLEPGSVHALVGENGAGKSTFIKVLTGVHAADAGEVRFLGDPVAFSRPADAQDAGISTIYQEINLVPLLTVAQNIYLGREPRRFGLVDTRALNRQAAELVQRLGIEVDVRAELGSLGLGVQQMVALARAVSIDARVVIMDEPTSSLEVREVETLFGVARTLAASGVGLVFVSHRLDELWALCDTVTVLRDGRAVHTGPMADLERVKLVALMLGREVSDVRAEGTTDFGASHAQGDAPLLSVSGVDVPNRLRGVGLTARPGEVVGLGGLLGSGRSETLKAIYGDLTTTAADVEVGGTKVKAGSVSRSLRAGIALLSEDRKAEGIVPDMSVRDNIALAVLPKMARGGMVSDARIDALVDTFMRRLQIKASSPRQKVRELSGGNQQKVLIARWLATEPRVFLLDEPTRGIDVGAKREVQGLIDELADQGLAVVLVSSEMDELVEGSDRVVVLHDGAVSGELDGDRLTSAELLRVLAGGIPDEHPTGPPPGPGTGANAVGTHPTTPGGDHRG